MTHDDVQVWLDRYVAAWKSFDPAEIGDLFSEDAEYRYHPWDEPLRGRDAIVADWVEPGGDATTRDAPGTYDAEYRPFAIEGDRAVAVGHSDYFAGPGGSARAPVSQQLPARVRCRRALQLIHRMVHPRARSVKPAVPVDCSLTSR